MGTPTCPPCPRSVASVEFVVRMSGKLNHKLLEQAFPGTPLPAVSLQGPVQHVASPRPDRVEGRGPGELGTARESLQLFGSEEPPLKKPGGELALPTAKLLPGGACHWPQMAASGTPMSTLHPSTAPHHAGPTHMWPLPPMHTLPLPAHPPPQGLLCRGS